ncbi:sulfurtransferase TusA family protein [Proteinivorax hydrogeniformans]|uniref:Sulfurtransferase TusA family protein n=1 Tax=Proteinivorax hydrogeniformans TaxID=1826727 RepID=A0AAU8HQ81_9FIRM
MAEFKLDCMHETCPIPLLKAVKALKKMELGDVLIMLTDHNCSISNVIEWVEKQGHKMDYMEIGQGEWEIYIEKARK